MGPPQLKPEPPALEWVRVAPDQRFVSKRLQECNYLQAMEGGIDSSHVSFLHGGSLKSDPLFVGARATSTTTATACRSSRWWSSTVACLIGARRNADDDRYYWRITPWIMPRHTMIPPRGGTR